MQVIMRSLESGGKQTGEDLLGGVKRELRGCACECVSEWILFVCASASDTATSVHFNGINFVRRAHVGALIKIPKVPLICSFTAVSLSIMFSLPCFNAYFEVSHQKQAIGMPNSKDKMVSLT